MNIEFNRNEDKMKQSLSEMRQRLEKIYWAEEKKPSKNKEKKINSPHGNVSIILLIRINPLSRSALLRVLTCMRNRADALLVAQLQVLDM